MPVSALNIIEKRIASKRADNILYLFNLCYDKGRITQDISSAIFFIVATKLGTGVSHIALGQIIDDAHVCAYPRQLYSDIGWRLQPNGISPILSFIFDAQGHWLVELLLLLEFSVKPLETFQYR